MSLPQSLQRIKTGNFLYTAVFALIYKRLLLYPRPYAYPGSDQARITPIHLRPSLLQAIEAEGLILGYGLPDAASETLHQIMLSDIAIYAFRHTSVYVGSGGVETNGQGWILPTAPLTSKGLDV